MVDGAKEELTPEERAYLERTYTYHAPQEGQPERYREVRHKVRDVAETFMVLARHSPERGNALRCLEEGVMWINAAIARHG